MPTLRHSCAQFVPQAECLLHGLGFWGLGLNDLAERGTPEFYREQAARLTAQAALALTPKSRLELLEVAAVFQKLADYAAASREHLAAATKTKSA